MVREYVQEPTIGAAFFTQILSLSEATVKFDIWDTAGQERYHSLAPMYHRGAAAAVVVYDISNMVATDYLWSFLSVLCSSNGKIMLHRPGYVPPFFALNITESSVKVKYNNRVNSKS